MSFSQEFFAEIENNFPSGFISQKQEDLEEYGRDRTRVYLPDPSLIVFPRSTEEVSRFLKLCTKHRVAVVPSGGRTGLAGGAMAPRGEVVLSLIRMNRMEPVDTLARTVRVQAGAVTEAVHQHCEECGLTWPVDFASKGSSQVGGNISTNAGGVRVIYYGNTRNWVLGLQVVLMDGTILELNGALEKNNTGIDLRQLFIGSEGILGVITEATLKLTKPPAAVDVFFFGVDGMSEVLKLFYEARKGPFTLTAFETLTHNCLAEAREMAGLQSPFRKASGAYVLMEVEKPSSASEQEILDQWLTGIIEKGFVRDGTLAQSPREARNLWSIREGVSEAISEKAFVHKNDISVPVASLDGFVADMTEMFRNKHADFEVCLWGHVGDGNLHINTLKPASAGQEEFLKRCHEADHDLFEIVERYHGSISAEHGIGLLKKEGLHYSRKPEEIAIFRAIKKALDPLGLMNRDKVFDLSAG